MACGKTCDFGGIGEVYSDQEYVQPGSQLSDQRQAVAGYEEILPFKPCGCSKEVRHRHLQFYWCSSALEVADAHCVHAVRRAETSRNGSLEDIVQRVPVDDKKITLVGAVAIYCDPDTYPTDVNYSLLSWLVQGSIPDMLGSVLHI